jgi:probable HAF family extracellular repeat protein
MTRVRLGTPRRAGRTARTGTGSLSPRRAVAASALGVLAAAALVGPAFATPAHAATTPQYKLTIVGSVGTEVFGINKTGDVFGIAREQGAKTDDGFLLAAGTTNMVFLGSPGDPSNTNSFSSPNGFNSSDDVVGTAASLSTGTANPIEWKDSATPTNLGTLSGLQNLNLTSTKLTSINDSGLITGFGSNRGDVGFTINGSTVTKLPALPNGGVDVEPIAVNDSGLIVGQADTTTSDFQAAEWQNGTVTALAMLPGSFTSEALAVNSSGEAVGADVLTSDDDGHAVLFANGKVTDLNAPGTGTPGADSVANAINDNGVIVGQGGNGDAFVYQNGQATDLNTLIAPGSGFTLLNADGINANGVIVGTASNSNGQTFGFELTPIS